VLKKVKINEQIWNSSMEQYLPPGEQYIKKALRFSLSSPFTFEGSQTEVEITKMYKEASDFAIQMVTVGKANDEKSDPSANFNKILVENLGDDEQDKLIVLDYIIIDYVLEHFGLSSQ
jgi:hypothetical protein